MTPVTRVLTELATRLQHDGQADAALSLWQSVRKLVVNDPAQRVKVDTQLAQLYLEQRRPDQALPLLQPLLDQVLSDDWQAQQLRGLIEQALWEQRGPTGLVEFWTERVCAARRPRGRSALSAGSGSSRSAARSAAAIRLDSATGAAAA